MGSEGHISFVFDEQMGYYGAPALWFGWSPPRVRHGAGNAVVRTFFTPELFEDISATIEGEGERYPATGKDARRAVEVVFAAYRAAATQTVVRLPLPDDDLYRHGLEKLHSTA